MEGKRYSPAIRSPLPGWTTPWEQVPSALQQPVALTSGGRQYIGDQRGSDLRAGGRSRRGSGHGVDSLVLSWRRGRKDPGSHQAPAQPLSTRWSTFSPTTSRATWEQRPPPTAGKAPSLSESGFSLPPNIFRECRLKPPAQKATSGARTERLQFSS